MPAPTLAALKAELMTDPAAQGYAPLRAAGDHVALATKLNLRSAASRVDRTILQSRDVWRAIVLTEFDALSTAARNRVMAVLGMGEIDPTDPNTRTVFGTAFAAGSASRTALQALIQRDGSRAETLWGAETVISHEQVGQALLLP